MAGLDPAIQQINKPYTARTGADWMAASRAVMTVPL